MKSKPRWMTSVIKTSETTSVSLKRQRIVPILPPKVAKG